MTAMANEIAWCAESGLVHGGVHYGLTGAKLNFLSLLLNNSNNFNIRLKSPWILQISK
jgi:hypothetical protein